MPDVKQDLQTAEKDAQAAVLAKVNADTGWLKANRAWLVIASAAAVAGFILGHLVKF